MDDVENQKDITNTFFEGGSLISGDECIDLGDECIDLLAPSQDLDYLKKLSVNKSGDNSESFARIDGLIEEIPEWLRDNEYLKSGYRMGQKGICEVTSTMCQCHNETVNIWTHFIGAISFIGFLVLLLVIYSNTEAIGYKGLYDFQRT